MTLPSREIWRKSVHFSGVFFVPALLWNRLVFSVLLLAFLAVYLAIEFSARRGIRIPLLSTLTDRCKRPRESGRLSRGALFLVFSGIVTPYLFGTAAAALGLAQTFVADTASAFTGMTWGSVKLPYNASKSWVGSLAFFVAAFLISLSVLSWPRALILAAVGAIVESLPIPDADNLLIPFAVGAAAMVLLR